MSAAVALEKLTFTYKGQEGPAIREIGLSIAEGRFIAIMGHAGSGKSTLCMCLNALVPRFFRGELQGAVVVNGIDVAASTVRDMSQAVGFIFQDFESQLVSTSVELELAFGPENYGVPRSDLRRRVDEYLALVRLGGLRNRDQASLSGGQKQLLAIASVLALETPILVMDEPTSDLDSMGREQILNIAERAATRGRSVIMVEHEPEAVMGTDQIVLMRGGRIVAHDGARSLLSRLDLLEECGIRPPQLLSLFQRLGFEESPFTVDESLALLKVGKQALHWTPEPARPLESPTILEARSLSYIYRDGNIEALQCVSLRIREGEFLAILGQNGSGKSTLGKLFSGLLRPTSGDVLAEGENTRAMSRKAFARFAGYVFQNPDCQIFATTVAEEVSFAPRNFGIPKDEIRSRVAQALRAVRLEGYEERDPFALTRGERQRVAVASILVSRPKVLILDEPTTGLDYGQQRSMMEMLTMLHSAGHTVVIITHSMWVAAEYAARTIVMRQGQITRDGPTRDVFVDEEILAAANLRPPPIVQLSNRLGAGALTVDEMATALTVK